MNKTEFSNLAKHFSIINSFKNYFKFDQRNAILKKEILGGISTFLAMCYILAVNPSLVGGSPMDPNLGFAGPTASMYAGGLFLATAISSFFGCFVMGLWARVPIALAPGMGLNAFFAFTVSASVGFESALSVTILSGILYVIVAITPIRQIITKSLPHNMKIAIGVGIGLFIAYIGLSNSGIITTGSGTLTEIGDFKNPLIILAVCLMFLGLVLHFTKVPASIVITMIVGAIILVILCVTGVVVPKDSNGNDLENYGLLGSYQDFSTFKDVIKAGWLGFANKQMWMSPMTYIGVLSFLYMDFFDTTGSLIIVDRMGKFSDTDPKWIGKANYVDSLCTVVGAGIGSTTVTSFVESSVGVASGARTGFASIITALCFALSIAIWPIMNVFMPVNGVQPITSCALVIVGAIMISQIRYFEWEIFADIPMLFITMIIMMLSNSISMGMAFGAVVYILINGSLGIMQLIKNKKNVVNDLTMPISETEDKLKTREFKYFRRLNWTIIIVGIIGLIYIIIDQIDWNSI